jgi:ABC-type Na+ efflux pump permease subunit
MLSIAWKDLLILFKDRNALVGAFLLPIVFIVVFLGVSGLSGGGGGGDGEAKRMALAVVNNDPAGATAQSLIESLGRDANIAVTQYPEADALTKLEAREIERVLVIPAAFSADVAAGGRPRSDWSTTASIGARTMRSSWPSRRDQDDVARAQDRGQPGAARRDAASQPLLRPGHVRGARGPYRAAPVRGVA